MKNKTTKILPELESEVMLTKIPCFIFSFAEHQPMMHMNAYALNCLGYSKNEIIGKIKFEELLSTGSKILFKTHFLPQLKLKGNVEEIILSLKTKGNSEFSILFNISMDKERNAKHFFAAGLPMDKRNEYEKGLLETIKNSEKIFSENKALTDLRINLESNQLTLEKRLQETNRLNDEHKQLNKVLAHNILEPIRKILFYADALPKDNNKLNKSRNKILNAAHDMRKIIGSLQRFYSLDYKFNTADRTNLLEIIGESRKESSAEEIQCDLKMIKALEFKGRPEHMKAVFKELIDNAIKFKQDTHPLKITIESQNLQKNIYKQSDERYKFENYIRINFSDNGIGFDDNHSSKIFQLFQKLQPNDGLGIGLSYCKKIVELYNGTISVKSIPNSGTTFTILLPNPI